MNTLLILFLRIGFFIYLNNPVCSLIFWTIPSFTNIFFLFWNDLLFYENNAHVYILPVRSNIFLKYKISTQCLSEQSFTMYDIIIPPVIYLYRQFWNSHFYFNANTILTSMERKNVLIRQNIYMGRRLFHYNRDEFFIYSQKAFFGLQIYKQSKRSFFNWQLLMTSMFMCIHWLTAWYISK